MLKTTLKLVLFFVCGHLLLGLSYLLVRSTHGISDRDLSGLVGDLFWYPNRPSFHLLQFLGVVDRPMSISEEILVVGAGVFQWTIVALAIAAVLFVLRLGVPADTQDKIRTEDEDGD